MKMKVQTGLVVAILCALLAIPNLLKSVSAAPADQKAPQTFTGEIMDSLCAKDGTHQGMMKEMVSMGHDKKTCTVKCAQLGAKYVLFDGDKKQVYNLDDQEKAEAFTGKKVRVSGTLQKNKIKVDNIQSAD